ncbi:MAG: hypothetical protein FD168_47 [Desulfobulbaceae bacterium]|nr:MAG: hypothetical protein FD168_47 [Desulfobulbaceae bacterium]
MSNVLSHLFRPLTILKTPGQRKKILFDIPLEKHGTIRTQAGMFFPGTRNPCAAGWIPLSGQPGWGLSGIGAGRSSRERPHRLDRHQGPRARS